jgi:hypothetical protein
VDGIAVLGDLVVEEEAREPYARQASGPRRASATASEFVRFGEDGSGCGFWRANLAVLDDLVPEDEARPISRPTWTARGCQW